MASEEERPVRPGSLVPPEKQPLEFDVQLLGAPPHVEQLVNNIKQVAEEYLYHWKTFPIVLPTSWCLAGGKAVRLQELLLAPALEELDALAVDDKGEPKRLSRKQLHSVRQRGVHKDKANKPKRLNAKQLESIRERGEFEVWSRNFPGQRHVWRVSGALQRGRARARATLGADAARAAALVLLVARDRLLRDTILSLVAGLKALLLGIQRLLDLIVGLPALAAHDLEHKLCEERARYLVAELVAKEGHTCESWSVCGWLTRQLRRARVEKFDAARECARAAPRVPFLYTTPRNDHIDLRLFARDTMRRAQPLLASILEREARGWFLHFRERLLNQLREQKVPHQDIDQEVRDAGMREYMSRVSAAVRSSTALAVLGDGIPNLLVQQLQATVLMHRSVEQVNNRLAQGRAGLRERLTAAYPLRARIPRWLHDKLEEASTRAEAEARWSAHEEAAAACVVHGLHQHAYFLQRDLAFMREREPLLLKELREVKSATRTFTWARQRWRVAHWVVERRCGGTAQRVPVSTAPRAAPVTARPDPAQPVYLLRRHTQYHTTTRWPGWRIANYAYRTWTWCWNTMFLLGVVIPWCSPLSLRALFCVQPFMPDYELSQVNGTLFPRKSSSTETVCSRLRALWRHISKARTHFETKPDTGLIGKGVTRLVNRTWNYGVKGVVGSALLLLLLPLACATVSVTGCLAALLAPLWVPVLALVTHVACATLYDFDCPDPINRNRYLCVGEAVLWRICVLGLLQPAIALLVAVLCVPAALLLLAVGSVRWCIRSAWDILVFRCVIKRRARVPAGDGVFAKRVAGPGLHHNYYFHIRAEQALCALTARVELEELAAWARNTEAAITRPLRDYAHFVSACFSPFSCQLAKSGPYQQLEKECGELVASLREKVEVRRSELDLALSQELRARVKLSASDLKVTIAAGARLAARVHPARSLAPGAADDWWGARGLAPLDWPALVAQLLAETFALEVLAPLGEEDVSFRLEPHSNLDLSRYQAMIRDLDTESCPDVVCDGGALASVVWGAAPRVQPPCLDTNVFNPRPHIALRQHATARSEAQHGTSWISGVPARWCWQRAPRANMPPTEPISRLPIPLPLPHPAMIALIIHNREAESPIPLDNDLCAELLRAVEDVAVDQDQQQESLEAATTVSSNESLETAGEVAADTLPCQPAYHWTLTNWAGGRRRHASGSVRVDLASPEDVTLDADSARVNFAPGGTSV